MKGDIYTNMPLVAEKDLLSLASKKNFAVPGFFPLNMDFLKIIIDVCEEERSPVILTQGPEFINSFGDKLFSKTCMLAAELARVPVALSVDHTFVTDDSTIELLKHDIDLGWGSVMIDASLLPYDDNVKLTSEVSTIAHEKGCTCIGSLGEVRRFFPQAMMYKGPFKDDFVNPKELLTDPAQAKDFVEKTNIDVLGVSVGQYIRSLWDGEKPPLKKTCHLNIDLIKKIKEETNVHLLLMGSTHVCENDLSLAARSGIDFIKVASEHALIWSDQVRKLLEKDKKIMFPEDIQKPALNAVKESMRNYIRLFNANNQI